MKDFGNKVSRILLTSVIFFLVFLFIYLIADYLALPLYTRKWQKVTVPDVTLLTNRVATKLLKKKGLNMVVQEEKYDNNYPSGFVLFQNPPPNSIVKKGRRIYLTIGKGLQVIEMPELIGISERDAKFILSENQLELSSITYKNNNSYPSGVVCEQSIEPLEKITIGEKINLVVSMGVDPNRIMVPDLLGKSREDALVQLNRIGLVFGGYEYQFTDQILPNTVLGQSPPSGTHVTQLDTVSITLSRLPEPDSTETEGGEIQ